MKILITGCAGFIGFHLSKKILNKTNIKIVGLDNLNSYYSVKLKKLRLNLLKRNKNFNFYKIDISNYNQLKKIYRKHKFDLVINLAAQAGVRYSIINPKEYIQTNVTGFFNILELSRIFNIRKVFYASSSSVYGDHKKFPLKENQNLIPKNIYSFSKKNNEDIAKIYQETFGLNSVGLRFFTVYGEWGRPDMLMIKYLLAKKNKKNFLLNNKGNHFRDFTYINDVIDIFTKLIFSKKKKKQVYNICSNKPISVKMILKKLDNLYGKPKIINKKKLSIEVLKTHGSNSEIKKIVKLKKFTDIDDGIKNLVLWAKRYLDKI
jgi:UDP-glucuronate 4-epimerase